jgi:hypothetical protein
MAQKTDHPWEVSMPVGVVVRRAPGVTRWAAHSWLAVGLLPGAGPGHWKELRRDGEAVEFHAGTLDLSLYRAETEAYLVALNNTPPLVWAILRNGDDDRPEPVKVTASAYEAQDYSDNGDDIVEALPCPEGLAAWIQDFVQHHHVDEEFIKRRRRPHFQDLKEDGIGDARVRQVADVYRTPKSRKGGEG